MEKERIFRDFREVYYEKYHFDVSIGKEEASAIALRLDALGVASNVMIFNDERYMDKVSMECGAISLMASMLPWYDVCDVTFLLYLDGVSYGVNIDMPDDLVCISYKAKAAQAPYDFEPMMRELERQFKAKG